MGQSVIGWKTANQASFGLEDSKCFRTFQPPQMSSIGYLDTVFTSVVLLFLSGVATGLGILLAATVEANNIATMILLIGGILGMILSSITFVFSLRIWLRSRQQMKQNTNMEQRLPLGGGHSDDSEDSKETDTSQLINQKQDIGSQ